MNKKQILMYGGSFNPPLNSHFSLAQQLINEYTQIQKIIFVPVNSKYQKRDLIANEHRYQMLKLVCDKNEQFEVSRIEIDSSRSLYTIETLKALAKIYPEYEMGFIIGSDNLKELYWWKNREELVSNFKVYVLERQNESIEEIIQADQFLTENKQCFIIAKNNIISNLSSTFARENLKKQKSIRYFAPDEVVNYIYENKLYR